jgi:flagellar biosynthesis protein FlhG
MDQADGLRRLLTATPTRVIAVAGMAHGVGTTTAAMNLSAALVRQGRQVVLLDEHVPAAQSVCAVWSIDAPGALEDVAGGRLGRDDAAAQAPCGVKVLSAPPGIAYGSFDPRLLCPAGVIVIDVAFDGAGELSAMAQRADELVIVMQPLASSITATYSGLKRLQLAHALRRFRFLVNEVTSPAQAQRIIANIVNASSRYLAVALQPAGWVRSDPLLRASSCLNRTVTEAYPTSAAADDFRRVAVEIGQWPLPATASRCAPSATKSIPGRSLPAGTAGRAGAPAA